MSDHPDLANLIGRSLDGIASITRIVDGVRVTTHCIPGLIGNPKDCLS